jgi:hypothetical protein
MVWYVLLRPLRPTHLILVRPQNSILVGPKYAEFLWESLLIPRSSTQWKRVRGKTRFRLSQNRTYYLSMICFELTRQVTKTHCQLSWKCCRWAAYKTRQKGHFMSPSGFFSSSHQYLTMVICENISFKGNFCPPSTDVSQGTFFDDIKFPLS